MPAGPSNSLVVMARKPCPWHSNLAACLRAIPAGTLTKHPFESRTKSGFGRVADGGGDARKIVVARFQSIPGNRHAPADQIFHWRQAHESLEALNERGARHADLRRQ